MAQARHMKADTRSAWDTNALLEGALRGRAARFVVAAGLAGAIAATPGLALAEGETAATAASDAQQVEQVALATQATDATAGEGSASSTEETSASVADSVEKEAVVESGATQATGTQTDATQVTATEPTAGETAEAQTSSSTLSAEATTSAAAQTAATTATTTQAEAAKQAEAATQPLEAQATTTSAATTATTSTATATTSSATQAVTAQSTTATATEAVAQGHWVVDDRSGSLQRYWVQADGSIATNRLVTPEEGAGYYAWASSDGIILRGKWDNGRGRVYVADNDGRLMGSDLTEDGWIVTNQYDGRMQRYWVSATDRAAVSGFFSVDGYGDSFGKANQGYVVREDFVFGGRKWSSDNDGKLRSGWYVTNFFDGSTQRYWMGDTVFGSAHAAAQDRLVTKEEGADYYAWATSDGTILRSKWDNGAGRVYVADNDGVLLGSDLTADGWVVTNHYDGCMQRYWVDATKRAACSGYFTIPNYGDCWGEADLGYVRRNVTFAFNGKTYSADNDGKLTEVTVDSKLEKFSSVLLSMAEDDSHGYDQEYRWNEYGDFDCSSLVIYCLQQAGFDTGDATYTGNMRSNLTARGWSLVHTSDITSCQLGDILLNDESHTSAIASKDGKLVEVAAHYNEFKGITGGTPGDQTGNEISVRQLSYYKNNNWWDVVLRYVGA